MKTKKRSLSPQSDESDDSFESEQEIKKPKVKRINKDKVGTSEKSSEPTPSVPLNSFPEDDPNEDLLSLELPPLPKTSFSQNGKDRLMIKSIEVFNFKSYHGKNIIGPFHKSFTSIIGPNGSGKSNVIDSLLFVFGFRSGKIRSKKVSNLIHSSSGKKCDNCTVTINFYRITDIDHISYKVIPGSSFSVSRTAYKNNSSTYALNGKTSSLKEVENYLKNCEIDLIHNRFLILQGEVEAISMMKAKGLTKHEEGMLEYLEDIIGSNRFVVPIEKLERRLDRISVEMSQKKIRREKAKSSKVALEGDVRNAIDFLNKENEVAKLNNTIFQRRRLKYLDQIREHEEELNSKEEERNGYDLKLDDNDKKIKDCEKLDKEMMKNKATLELNMDEKQKLIDDELTAEKRRSQNLKRINADLEKLNAQKEKEEKARKTLLEVPEKASKKIEKLKVESELLLDIEKTANEKADENLSKFDEQSKEFREEKVMAEKNFADINSKFNAVKGKATVAEAELNDLIKLANKAKNTLNELNHKRQEAETKLMEDKKELLTIEQKLPSDEKILNDAINEAPSIRLKDNQLSREIREIKMKIHEMENEKNRKVSGNRTLEALTKEKREGRISGFLGRLGDLGAIDSKYDVAISTNCGFLNYYVCSDSDSAELSINFLQEKKLGRANFISLDKLRIDRNKMNMDSSQFPAPRLFDLVRCEDYIRIAFYFALGDILVTNNLSEAQNIDKRYGGRFNIVTLNGSKLSNDGSITGGGEPRRGYIGTDIRVKQNDANSDDIIRNLKAEYETKNEDYIRVSEKCRKIEAQITELRTSVAARNQKKKALLASIEQTKSVLETLCKTIDIQSKETETVVVEEEEINEKKKTVYDLIEERDKCGAIVEESKQRVDEVTQKIDLIFEELVEQFKRESKEARDKRTSIEKAIAKETSSINNSERNIAKCDDKLNQINKDIEKKLAEIDKLEHQKIDNEVIEKMKSEIEDIALSLKNLEQEFIKIRERNNEMSHENVELEKKRKVVIEEISILKTKAIDRRRKVDDIERELKNLKLNKIPKLSMLDPKNRPEDLKIEFEEELNFDDLADMDLEEINNVRKKLANDCTDKVYTMEFGMRNNAQNQIEGIDEGDVGELEKIPMMTDEELRQIDEDNANELVFRRKNLEKSLDAMKASVNLTVIEEYIERVKKYNEVTSELLDITKNYNAHRLKWLEFKKQRSMEFKEGFSVIAESVREVYQMLTIGGDARLIEKSGADPFSEGIQFSVRPSKKAWKEIENLSGGEKTLASLSLVFALHTYRPTPFYVMDEIDAALDYRNVTIIANYVKEKTRNAQFIIISLRNNMFEIADRLIGIYKVNDCTKNVAIDPITTCHLAKSLGDKVLKPILPEEVTREFRLGKEQERLDDERGEKEYADFPSTSEIRRAEMILELKMKRDLVERGKEVEKSKEISKESRPRTRTDSRILEKVKVPNVRLVVDNKGPTEMNIEQQELQEKRPGWNEDDNDIRKVCNSNLSACDENSIV